MISAGSNRRLLKLSVLAKIPMMRHFVKCVVLSMGVQGALWILLLLVSFLLSPRLDSFVEGFVYLYYPTIVLVERLAGFKGDANPIRPILLGVPLGMVVYSVIAGAILSHVKRPTV